MTIIISSQNTENIIRKKNKIYLQRPLYVYLKIKTNILYLLGIIIINKY